jgi:hypothetical protein
MAIRKWSGVLVACGLVGLIAAGCSSSNGAAAGDAGDAAVRRMLDAAISIGGDDSGAQGAFDGTTGKQCTQDSDCVGPDGGAGINTCSVDYGFTITGVSVALWATPVCIIPPPQSASQGNCDPVPAGVDDGLPHFCDGPDDPTSPGLCLPFDLNNPQPGQGVCYPLCTFGLDGQKPTGCVGTDECFPVTFLRSSTDGTVTGYGFCAGGCQQDSDCTGLGAGFVCQTDIGYCTMMKVTRTKPIGAACMAATTAGSADDIACNCDADPTTGLGDCSSACVVGGLPCAGGQICDAGFQNPITFTSSAGGASVSVPVTAQNIGIPGVCRTPCTPADAGVVDAGPVPQVDSGDDGSADAAVAVGTDGGPVSCPTNTTCQTGNVVGPDCIP